MPTQGALALETREPAPDALTPMELWRAGEALKAMRAAGVEHGRLDGDRFTIAAAARVAVEDLPWPPRVVGEPERLHAHELAELIEEAAEWEEVPPYEAWEPGNPPARNPGEAVRGKPLSAVELVDYDPARYAPYTDLARIGDGWFLLEVAG